MISGNLRRNAREGRLMSLGSQTPDEAASPYATGSKMIRQLLEACFSIEGGTGYWLRFCWFCPSFSSSCIPFLNDVTDPPRARIAAGSRRPNRTSTMTAKTSNSTGPKPNMLVLSRLRLWQGHYCPEFIWRSGRLRLQSSRS